MGLCTYTEHGVFRVRVRVLSGSSCSVSRSESEVANPGRIRLFRSLVLVIPFWGLFFFFEFYLPSYS